MANAPKDGRAPKGAAPVPFGGTLPEGGDLAGPLYVQENVNSLGSEPLGGPTGGKRPGDPLGLLHGLGGKGKKGKK